jgi:tetratricopeptide (TPR) repeat protein
MRNDKKKPVGSSFPISQSMTNQTQPSRMPGEKVYEELDAALEAGDNPRALELLDGAPNWMKRQPEIMLIHASVLISLGKDQESLQLMHEIERKYPRFTALYLPLSLFYMDKGWPAHALQAVSRALADRNLDEEDRTTADELIEEATALIKDHAAESDLSYESMRRACIFHEQALIAMQDAKLSEGEHLSREAIKIAPNWNPAHITRADALFYLGKTSEAIAESEAVLGRDANNVFALCNLVTYHFGLDQPEKAQAYATRLLDLSKNYSPDNMKIDAVITALALVEDTPALWKIGKRYLEAPPETLFGRSWQCLAVAAIRSGKWKDALQLIEKAQKKDLTPYENEFVDELKVAAVQRLPRLKWMPPTYPGVDQLLHPNIIVEWDGLLKNSIDPPSPTQKRKLDDFLQKYPVMIDAMKRLLLQKDTHEIALLVLKMTDTADADGEILRFALSKTGTWGTRVNAVLALTQIGRYSGPKIVKLWHEDLEEWHEVELNTQRVGNIKANALPQTMAYIEKANKTKNLQEGIALLRKAIEMEPTSPNAYFNLGLMLTLNGKIEEGETFLQRSLEVDPNYLYGHASIALKEATWGNEQDALDHLEVVSQADIISPETALVANLAWTSLHIQTENLKSARQQFDMATRINPEYPLLERFEKMLKEAEDTDMYL